MQGLGVLAGFLQRALQLSAAGVGLLITVAGTAPIIALLIVGHLLDRHDERSVVGVGGVLAAAGLCVAALPGGYPVMLLGLFVFGIGYSTVQPGGSKSVALWFSHRRRGVAMGIRQAGLPLGGAAAALVLPVVVERYGWRPAFTVAAGIVVVGCAALVIVYKRPRSFEAATQVQALWPRLAAQLRKPTMTAIFVSGVALVTAQYAVTTYFMVFLRDRDGIPLSRTALLFFAVQAAGVVGRIVLAVASDRPGSDRRSWIQRCMLGTAVLLAVFPLLPADEAVIGGFAVCLGFFGYGWYGPWVAHVSESCAPDQVGLALGTAMAVNQVAIVATPPLLGLVSDLCGFRVMWWLIAAVLAPLALVARVARGGSGVSH